MTRSLVIATVGYEALAPSDLVALLLQNDIARLVDVRAIANSRRPGYSKRALAAELARANIAYEHMRALGTPKEGRQAVREGRPAEMRRIYAAHLAREDAQAALAELAATASVTPSCLLCLEANPAHCHRTIIAEALAQHWRFRVRHLAWG